MANTLFIGKVYHRFDEIPSTNDCARDLLTKSKPPEGTVIRSASQSAGRGQYGSRWLSDPGQNLLLSIILYPVWLPATQQFRLSEAIALAVLDTVRSLPFPVDLPHSSVKWPNDIYLGDGKTAGILIQNALSGQFLQSSIVGIGLNVNQTTFAPEVPNATSLALVAGIAQNLDFIADLLFACVERRYLQLRTGNVAALRAEYHTHLYSRGQKRAFGRPDGNRFWGTIMGVGDDGRLTIRTDLGDEVFGLKEVAFV